jgi:hypothetical protein
MGRNDVIYVIDGLLHNYSSLRAVGTTISLFPVDNRVIGVCPRRLIRNIDAEWTSPLWWIFLTYDLSIGEEECPARVLRINQRAWPAA